MVKLLMLLLLFFVTKTICSFGNRDNDILCNESERDTLLRFKEGLEDPSNRLSSWVLEVDCCEWEGVTCDNLTGHVKELKLANPQDDAGNFKLRGKISDSILSLNDPSSFGQNLYSESLRWLQRLRSLSSLDLSYADLSKVSNWLLEINKLPSLVELRLSRCKLNHITPLSHVNFSSLSVLDISSNYFNGFIPNWISNLGSLVSLDLRGGYFQGPLPEGFSNLTSLENLNVAYNYLNSSLPKWLFSLTSISSLDLHGNDFQGPIPCGFQNSSAVTYLDLSDISFNSTMPNSLRGEISNDTSNLTNLVSIDLSENAFEGNIPR
ncbi:receptor like protein 30-like [Momordica charantia]|uniref:Receptor like protein 30-like n=1 Tax=Momordica charantia TaxID=3673 RepID=A0A6J1CI12_MOMCH|nr:receptor like protein 30-like [Momordica charantia]